MAEISSAKESPPRSPMMGWTALAAGLVLAAFACLLIVIGSAAQQSFVQPLFGVATTFGLAGMGIEGGIDKILQALPQRSKV